MLKSSFKRKLIRECMKRHGEEKCREAVEILEGILEERFRKALEEVLGNVQEGND